MKGEIIKKTAEIDIADKNFCAASDFRAWMEEHAEEDKLFLTPGEHLLAWFEGLKTGQENYKLLNTYDNFSMFCSYLNDKGFKIDPVPSKEDYRARSTVRMAAQHFKDWAKNKKNLEEYRGVADNQLYLEWAGDKGGRKAVNYPRFSSVAAYLDDMGFRTIPAPVLNEYLYATKGGADARKGMQRRLLARRKNKLAAGETAMPS